MESSGFTKVCSKILWLPGEFWWKCILPWRKVLDVWPCDNLGVLLLLNFKICFNICLFLIVEKSLAKGLIIKFINLIFVLNFLKILLLFCHVKLLSWNAILADLLFSFPWFLQWDVHVCVCVSAGIQGTKDAFVYQAAEGRLCSFPVTDKNHYFHP